MIHLFIRNGLGAPSFRMAHFEFIEALGCGGGGEVFKARHTPSGCFVAIKRVKKRLWKAIDVHVEVDALQSIEGCNLALEYLGWADSQSHYNLITRFYPGGDFLQEIRCWGGRLPRSLLIHRITEMITFLVLLRCIGMIHRDIKPQNMLIDEHGRMKLSDFGLVMYVRPDTADMAHNISTEPLVAHPRECGTYPYMAPEVILRQSIGFASDLFSVGISAFEAYFGKPLWAMEGTESHKDTEDIVSRHWTSFIPPGFQMDDGPLYEFFEAVFVKNPRKRPNVYEIRSLPLFDGVDWPALVTGNILPPPLDVSPPTLDPKRLSGDTIADSGVQVNGDDARGLLPAGLLHDLSVLGDWDEPDSIAPVSMEDLVRPGPLPRNFIDLTEDCGAPASRHASLVLVSSGDIFVNVQGSAGPEIVPAIQSSDIPGLILPVTDPSNQPHSYLFPNNTPLKPTYSIGSNVHISISQVPLCSLGNTYYSKPAASCTKFIDAHAATFLSEDSTVCGEPCAKVFDPESLVHLIHEAKAGAGTVYFNPNIPLPPPMFDGVEKAMKFIDFTIGAVQNTCILVMSWLTIS